VERVSAVLAQFCRCITAFKKACRVGKQRGRIAARVKYWRPALAIFALSASLALADDFKTNDGKEYKNATISRVEPDGIVLKTKSGISKVYFVELPKEVQERFHYDPEKAAAAQAAAVQQTQEMNRQAAELYKQQKEQQQRHGGQAARQQNIQALVNAYQGLLQQEEDLLAEIGRAKNAQENARRKWYTGSWGQAEPQSRQYQTDSAEANLPLLEGRLQNVRDEKQRVREELERAQRESR
jgi:hypothetical protein